MGPEGLTRDGPRRRVENIKIEDLGKAKKITIDKDNTTIIEGAGASSAIEGRVKQDRKSTRLNSSHIQKSRMPSSA